ncbi:hypothetical protein KW798_01765 [Candidatus Parcubacteria bacterium]|nr:hypothetical protein [Candidatus Parcubacteria bacterium]
MNIAYVVNTRIPTEKAHGYQIMRVCSELAKLGHKVTLYVPTRTNKIEGDPFEYYGLEPNFHIERVQSFDAMRYVKFLGPTAFWLTNWSFLRALTLPADSIVYTRDADAVAYLSGQGFKCVYNAHNWEPSRTARVRPALGAVCNSYGTEHALKESLNIPTIVAPNATDPNAYVGQKDALRKELHLPQGPLALYAGHVYGWKGVNTLVEAAHLVPDVCLVVIGGTMESTASNLQFATQNV